jgi:glucose-6-phosphate isomerase
MLIALFERTVGFYASLININAYHQPGVEAGKKAAATVLQLQHQALAALSKDEKTAGEIAKAIGAPDSVETIFLTLQHLAANGRAKETKKDKPDATKFAAVS